MYITLKEEFKENKNSFIYISVYEKDIDKYQSFIDEIKIEGFNYFLFVKNEINVNNKYLVEQSIEMLKKSDIGILILDDNLIFNSELYRYTILEAGILIDKTLMICSDLSNDGVKKFMESPIRDIELSNRKMILKAIEEHLFLPTDLFKNQDIDAYTRNRIFYDRFIVMLDIRYKIINKLYKRLNRVEEVTLKETFDKFSESVKTGTTFISFGKKSHLDNPYLWPYYEELKPLEIDFPVRHVVNKIMVMPKGIEDENEDEDVVATIKMEFIVPNNNLMGASFQPFFEVDGINPDLLIEALVDDGISIDDIRKYDNRIYFPINCNDMTTEVLDELKEKYGNNCCFIYPK